MIITSQKSILIGMAIIVTSMGLFGGVNAQEPLDAIVELDKKTYTWTDKVYITISAPTYNSASGIIDEIGEKAEGMVTIKTKNHQINNYKLVETGPDTGVFTGTVTLTGFLHDADGNPNTGDENGNDVGFSGPSGNGPNDGLLPADARTLGLTVSFEFSEDETFVGSAFIKWNMGQVQWLANDYDATGTGTVRITDPDMNLNPSSIDSFVVDVWSDADSGGIDLTVTETNESSGIFEGTMFFSPTGETSGKTLRVVEEGAVTVEYEDNTLPSPYMIGDKSDIVDTATIRKIPPLPPYKQLTMGVITTDIVCKDGFEQIFKPSGNVSCVTPLTAQELTQRDWSTVSIPVNFVGEWKNKDSNTSGIVNLVITQDDSDVTIHAWAADRPELDDWGTASGTVNGNSATITWDLGYITHDLVIKKIGNELWVDRTSNNIEPQWSQKWQEYFIPRLHGQTTVYETESEIMDRKYQMTADKNMMTFGEFLRVDVKIDSSVTTPHEIKVVGPDGKIHASITSESDDEHGWSFQAKKNWPTGTYEIQLWHSGEKTISSTFILQN